MLALRSLLVTGYGVRLSARKGAFVVASGEGKRYVSPSEVDLIVVATGGVSVTSSAVRLAARHGIELVFLDSRGMPSAALYMPFRTRTPDTRRAQYSAYGGRLGVELAAEFALAKMANQARHLRWRATLHGRPELREAAAYIERLAGELSERVEGFASVDEARGEIMRYEASAARAYWAGLAGLLPRSLGFDGRDPDSCDPVNLALNYGYGILYPVAIRALLLAGLDPYAGFLHADRSGKPVLAFDFVEMFRVAAVDRPVVDLFVGGWSPRPDGCALGAGDRREVAAAVLRALSGRVRGVHDHAPMTLDDAVRVYAFRLARSLRSSSAFRGFVER